MTTNDRNPAGRTGGRTTRSLVEGALLAALAALFAVLGLTPVFFFLTLAIPVPLTIVGYRYGLRTAAASATVAIVLTFLLSGSPIAVGEVIAAAAGGLVIAYGVRRGYPAMRTVLLATGAAFLSWVGEFLFSLWVMGINLWEKEVKFNRAGLKQSLELQKTLQKKAPGVVSPEAIQQFEAASGWFIRILPLLWPFSIVAGSFGVGVVNYGIIRGSFRRLKLGDLPAFPPFRSWRLPEWAGWLAVAAFGLGYADARWHLPGTGIATLNLFFLCLFAFLIEGLAVAWYYFDRWGVDRFTRLLILGFGFMVSVGILVLSAIGFLDVFLDYRQPREGDAV